MKLFLALVLSLFSSIALAQGSANPTGQFTPGHPLRANTASGSPYSDGGGAAGTTIGRSDYLSEWGITAPGLPACINDRFIDDPNGYHRLCFGHDIDGRANITIDDLGGATTTGLDIIINGIPYAFPQTNGAVGFGVVPDDAGLIAAKLADFPTGVLRVDFVVGRNAGPLFFIGQVGTCAANSMVNNGGSCRDNSEGNSFKAIHPAAGSSPKEWGCIGDGVADDTACLQAAFTAAGGRKVNLIVARDEIYAVNSTIVCSTPVQVIGDSGANSANYSNQTGFRALVTNLTLLRITTGCSGVEFSDLFFDMGAAGTNTSGAAIEMGSSMNTGIPARVTLRNIGITRPCIGIELNGNSHIVDAANISQTSGVGCGGIRVGHYTQALTVGPRIINSTIQSVITGSGTPASFGMRFEDSGGAYVSNDDILFSTKGTVIMPAANQGVRWSFFENTVLGDTTVEEGLFIDTAASNITHMRGNSFNGVWAAASTSTGGKPLVTVQNTAGATDANIAELKISNSRFFSTSGNGIDILAGTSFKINDNQVCAYGRPGTPKIGVHVGTNITDFSITNNTIKPDCAGGGGSETFAIQLDSGVDKGLIIGNTMKLLATANISYTPVLGTERMIIENNYPLSAACGNVTSAATISLTMFDCDFILGNAVITRIDNSGWVARKKRLFLQDGASFATGGTVGSGPSGPFNTALPVKGLGYVADAYWNASGHTWTVK